MRVVSFIVRYKGVIPELLCMEHALEGLVIPEGEVLDGEEPRRAGLRIASRFSDLGNFSSIAQIASENDGDLRFFKIVRNEPPGALGYWRHRLGGEIVKVRWLSMDGRIPLSPEPGKWLARHETLLLNF
jgi:hypothetical protein